MRNLREEVTVSLSLQEASELQNIRGKEKKGFGLLASYVLILTQLSHSFVVLWFERKTVSRNSCV